MSRIGQSLMTNLGLADWIAFDEESYVSKAAGFAGDIDSLARLRSGMRERMLASPIMDEQGFANDVENPNRDMW